MTKPITAVATLILLEASTVPSTTSSQRPVSVRDLLTFKMGFGAYVGPSPVNDAASGLELGVGPPQPALPSEPGEWTRRFSTLLPRAGGFSCP
jgi:hypothetical protein